MADPEQIYQEVLQEEQGKGVTPVVAEGRAKSARARAEEGSPHPKEPKWWPGAQPHFEGGDAGGEADEAAEEEPAEEEAAEEEAAEEEPAEEEAAEEEPAEEEPAEEEAAEEEAASVEEPAAEAPAEEPTAEEPTAEEPTAEEPAAEEPAAEEPAAAEPAAAEPAAEKPAEPPAEAPAAKPAEAPAAEKPAAAPKPPPAPAEQPAAAAAQPAAAAAAPAQPAGTLGVSHGTATGIRLRPEDEVSTEAQFEGQQAMYERRKLIDELVATGVPAVTAHDTDRPRTPWLAVLYLLIPLLVIFYLAGREDETVAPADGGGTATESPAAGGGAGGALALVAEDTAWDTKTLTFKADEPTSLEVENRDPTVHNMLIYPDPDAASAKQDPLFTGLDVPGGETVTYEIDPLKAGEYTYICGFHSNMVGDLLVE